MTILGIDPALASIGWGVIDNDRPIAHDYGIITTNKGDVVCDRLASIEADIIGLVQQVKPGVVAIEHPFFGARNTNAVVVQQAFGVIRLALGKCGYRDPVFLHQSQVKAAILRGNASKQEVKAAIIQLFGLTVTKGRDDQYDAIAVAYAAQQGVRANVA